MKLSLPVQFKDHISLDIDLPGFVDQRCGKVQSPSKPGATEVGEDFVQIQVRFEVVAIAIL